MADDRYTYYRGDNGSNRDRDVYLDNRTGVGPGRGRGYRASYGSDRGYDRAYGEDDTREHNRDQGYSTYGNSRESRSFRPEDYGVGGYGTERNEGYGARSYQSGGVRPQPETYGAYRSSRIAPRDDSGEWQVAIGPEAAFSPGFGHDLSGGRSVPYYGRDRNEPHRRDFWDRAGDTVASWLGDDEARRRHEADVRASHRGKGPKGYKRSDDRIRDDVNERLTDDLWLDATHIDVTVKESEITLSGTVTSRDDRRYAERIAESVSGTTHVQNNLRVAASQTGSTQSQSDILDQQARGKH